MEQRILEVGQSVIWVDEHGLPQHALLTAIHGDEHEHEGVVHYPCCNLVYTSSDGSKTDPYGRQIERQTSVPHKLEQSAHGWYWMWAGEEPNPPAKTRS
jgi:hypothetical protein